MANGTFSGVTSNSYVQVRITWESTSDVLSNTSHVTATLQLYKNSTYASRTYGTGSWKLAIGDSSVTKKVTVSLYADAGWVTVLKHSADIPHQSDGTKSIAISASGGISGTTLSSITCNRTVALDNIARVSRVIFESERTFAGAPLAFTIESADASFTHTARFSLGEFEEVLPLADAAGGSFTPPLDWCSAIPAAQSANATCTIETYSGDTLIGTSQSTFTLEVPSDVIPHLTSVRCDVVGGAFDLFLQNKSRCNFVFVDAQGIYGSTVSAYVVTGLATSTQNTITSGVLSSSGVLSFDCYIIDSRGRKSETVSCTIEVQPYQTPTLYASVYRCDADGNPDSDGTFLLVQADYEISPLSGNNSALCTVTYRVTGADQSSSPYELQDSVPSVIGGNVDVAASYEVQFSVTDALGAQASYAAHISPGFRLMNANGTSNGIAFGRMSTKSALQCALDAEFEKALQVNGDTTLSGKLQVEGDMTILGALHITQDAIRSLALCFMPVGYIYTSRNETDPGVLFGGTWQRIEDVFLLASGSKYPANSTGGEAEHVLTAEEMPAHKHKYYGAYTNLTAGSTAMPEIYRNTKGSTHSLDTGSAGGGAAHNNMPPYLALYMWERTA